MFSTLDIGIVVFFMLFTLIAGVWMSKKASKSMESYFLGDRDQPWYLLGIAGMTSWFDLTGTILVTSFLFILGPRGLFLEFRGGAVLILVMLILWTGKWHRRSGCMTIAEWMIFRFGNTSGAKAIRALTAILAFVAAVGGLAYMTKGTSVFLSSFDLPLSLTVSTALLMGLCTLYTMMSGFYGMIVTDLIQGIKIVIISIIVSIIAYNSVHNSHELGVMAQKIVGSDDWLTAYPPVHTHMPHGYEMYQALLLFSLIYLFRNLLGGLGTGGDSRYFAAKSDRECGLQGMLQGLVIAFRWPLMMAVAVLGLYLVNSLVPDMSQISVAVDLIKQANPGVLESNWHDLINLLAHNSAAYPQLINQLQGVLGSQWQKVIPLLSYNGTIDPENIFAAVLFYSLPNGVKGLLLASMLAAMMSCVSSYLQSTAALMVRDLYQGFLRPKAGNRELISASWIATALLMICGFTMGIAADTINSLWGWIIMGLGGGTLAALLRLYWWRCTAWGMVIGQFIGGVGAITQRIFWPEMLEFNQFMLMGGMSFAGVIIGSLLTKPADSAILMQFYRQTRPFGLWGPFKQRLSAAERTLFHREHKSDISAVPFTLLAQVNLFLAPMLLIIHSFTAMWISSALFAIGALGMYLVWWRHVPKNE